MCDIGNTFQTSIKEIEKIGKTNKKVGLHLWRIYK